MKTQLLATMVVGFAALGVAGFGFSTNGPSSSITNDAGFATGHIELVVLGPDGEIKQYQQTDNVIPTIGLQSVSDLVLGTGIVTGEGTFDTIAVGTGTTADGSGNTISDLAQRSNRLQDSSVATNGNGGDISVSWDGQNTGGIGNTITNGTAETINQVVLTTGGTTNNTTNQPILAYQADNVSVSVGSADTLTVTWTVAFSDN